MICKYFLPSVGCLFTYWLCPLVHKRSQFLQSTIYLFFSSVVCTFCVILKKSLSNLMLCRFYSTCSSQSFIVVFVMLRSWSLWISLCMLCKIRVQLYSFAGGYPVFPLPLVENTVFHHLMILAPLSKPFDHMWPQRQRLAWYGHKSKECQQTSPGTKLPVTCWGRARHSLTQSWRGDLGI